MKPADFWRATNMLAQEKKMDAVLAYMYLMLEKAHATQQSIQRKSFVAAGKKLKFFPGVEDWFARINRFGADRDVKIEHYIISSGLREIIEGSGIMKNFREVFACEFLYNENNVACWPKNVVNYTTKSQFLFRINKGVLDLSDDNTLNKFTPEDQRPVPFRNMIYIGDGYSDVPCMKLVKSNGGYSIAVYPKGKKTKVAHLLIHGRVDYLAPADYSENSELDTIIRDIVGKMALTDSLKRKSKEQYDSISKKKEA
jgi:2-hydroxy-3-keto-5-methylthiopentenyl-1-phosphate phosphatase